MSRCCFHNELCSVAGTVHGDDIFVAGPRQDIAKMGATLEKRWETRDQMIGPEPSDQKELRILNRTLRWFKDGLVFCSEFETRQRGCRRDGTEQVETSTVFPPREMVRRGAGVTNSNRLMKKRNVCTSGLWQKLNYLAHGRLDLKYATSCLASAVSSPCLGDAGGETSWALLEESTRCLARFLLSRPMARRALVLHGC